MTQTEKQLIAALEDAEAAFGLLEATLRQGKLEPLAEIVRGFRNKASRALVDVSRETAPPSPWRGPPIDFAADPLGG